MIFFLSSDTRGPSIDCLFFCLLSSDETTLLTQWQENVPFPVWDLYRCHLHGHCFTDLFHQTSTEALPWVEGESKQWFYLEFAGTGKFHYLAKGKVHSKNKSPFPSDYYWNWLSDKDLDTRRFHERSLGILMLVLAGNERSQNHCGCPCLWMRRIGW